MNDISTGKRNLISDVDGIMVGNKADNKLKSGVTAIVCEAPFIAAVHVMGGAPGTRETDLLSPENVVEEVDGLILSGGSAFGLDAASGAQAAMREMGRGFEIGPLRVPIIPAAILFDLMNGGDKDWGQYPPYRELGYDAVQVADTEFELGSVGAGTGALSAVCKGGLGSASTVITLEDGQKITIGALVAVNPLGSPLVGDGRHFWAAPFEMNDEFGGLGVAHPFPINANSLRIKGREAQKSSANTTIAVIATDAVLNTAQAKRLAVASHDGFARAIYPSHTPLDGDLIFSLATGKSGVAPDISLQIDLGAIAANTMSRAIARGVYAATKAEHDVLPVWTTLK
ncbi:MAG: P1 family peptidase [Rhizobiales bacterium]|nr:P1 family peptidase [Hyphomicrobiales bacterium]